MKETVIEGTRTSEITYPCLMRSVVNENIYYMVGHGKGVRIVAAPNATYGAYSGSLCMDSLEIFNGTITLEN